MTKSCDGLARKCLWSQTVRHKSQETLEMLPEFQHTCYRRSGRVDMPRHGMSLTFTNVQIVDCAPFSVELMVPNFESAEINKMEWMNAVKSLQSEWVSLNAFATELNGWLTFFVYYRKFNVTFVRELYPVCNMDWLPNSLGQAWIISTFDSKSGYSQIERDDCYKIMKKFKTQNELLRFLQTLFRLKKVLQHSRERWQLYWWPFNGNLGSSMLTII